MSYVPTVLKSDRSVFDKMLPVHDIEGSHSLDEHEECKKEKSERWLLSLVLLSTWSRDKQPKVAQVNEGEALKITL